MAFRHRHGPPRPPRRLARTCSTRARRSGGCSTTTSAPASASSPTGSCAPSAWEAARGFELTDEVRTVVAGHAACSMLGLDESWYDDVGTIVVRSGAMTERRRQRRPDQGIVDGSPMRRRRRGAPRRRPGDGVVARRPARGRPDRARPRRRAARVRPQDRHARRHARRHPAPRRRRRTSAAGSTCARAEYRRSCAGHRRAILRDYAGTNPGEFFVGGDRDVLHPAVSMVAEQMPDLYEVFAAFYRQDPAARVRRYIDRVVAANPAAAAAVANRPRIVGATPSRPSADLVGVRRHDVRRRVSWHEAVGRRVQAPPALSVTSIGVKSAPVMSTPLPEQRVGRGRRCRWCRPRRSVAR